MKYIIAIFLILIIFTAGCSSAKSAVDINKGISADKNKNSNFNEQKNNDEVLKMKLTSPDFKHNEAMPSELTCDDADVSPGLHIQDAPENAQSLALIMDDPDAPRGNFVHWIVWNISPNIKTILKGSEPNGTQGITGFRRKGYGGPCPPSGTHRYFFKLYALDTKLSLPEGSSKSDLESAMQGHIIDKAEIMGTYERQ